MPLTDWLPIALALVALVGAAAVLISASRSRPTAALAVAGQGRGRFRLSAALLAVLVVAAALIEAYGLRVSLGAYGDQPPPAYHAAILAGLITFFFLVSYFLYIWSSHRFTLRRHPKRRAD